MRTFPVTDEQGFKFGFEIENIYIGLKQIKKLLSSIENVTILHSRALFDFGNEIHVEFDYLGESFVVWEPFADSSRYLIVPKESLDRKIDISEIEEVFSRYEPPICIKVIGDLLSFKFLSLLRQHGNSSESRRGSDND